MQESFYAKSAISKLYGRRPYVREHLLAVAEQAAAFAAPFDRTKEAYLAGLFHDFGKYGEKFQRALDLPRNEKTNLNHAVCGAILLWRMKQKNGSLRDGAWKAVIEVVNSASKGEMDVVSPLIIFQHRGAETNTNAEQRKQEARLGCAPAHKLFELVKVEKKPGLTRPPRSYRDYDARINLEGLKKYPGVRVGFQSNPYGEIVWDSLPLDEDWLREA